MNQYKIFTDTTADLPDSYIKEHDLGMMYMHYYVDDEEYGEGRELPYKEFYAKMRAGSMPYTSQINPEDYRKTFAAFLENTSEDILYIAFSSGLSGSCGNAVMVARELEEEYPGRRVVVVDSLSASLGEGLLVHKALALKEQGRSLDEVAQWVLDNRLNICHYFTVDDLNHLHRGGRLSKTAAVLGTIVNIKPVLHVDNEGHLVPTGKIRGRKKSLAALVEKMEQQMGRFREQNDIVFISHGDALEDAEYVKKLVQERTGIDQFLISPVGPTIGAHVGPGMLALLFMGEGR